MAVTIGLRNESLRKRVCRGETLRKLAERVCQGEGVGGDAQISVLLCDDTRMRDLNRQYRNIDKTTDVLSFEQESNPAHPESVLGDIVISLETVERECGGDRTHMRDEIAMLFCHGLLHLLGYNHGTRAERDEMMRKQAEYLGVSPNEAWRFGPRFVPKTHAVQGGSQSGGRR